MTFASLNDNSGPNSLLERIHMFALGAETSSLLTAYLLPFIAS